MGIAGREFVNAIIDHMANISGNASADITKRLIEEKSLRNIRKMSEVMSPEKQDLIANNLITKDRYKEVMAANPSGPVGGNRAFITGKNEIYIPTADMSYGAGGIPHEGRHLQQHLNIYNPDQTIALPNFQMGPLGYPNNVVGGGPPGTSLEGPVAKVSDFGSAYGSEFKYFGAYNTRNEIDAMLSDYATQEKTGTLGKISGMSRSVKEKNIWDSIPDWFKEHWRSTIGIGGAIPLSQQLGIKESQTS